MIKQQNMQLALDRIAVDPDLQPRTGIDRKTVEAYADDMQRGDQFPPIVVFFDGEHFWLGDGFHRLAAARAIKAETISCEVHQGDDADDMRRQALLYSCGCNSTHGLRRTNDDKRLAVTKLLTDQEWSQWSDHEIARRCHVDNHTVMRLRRSLGKSPSEKTSSERTYRTKHGKTAKMKTGKIGKSKSPAKPKMPPQIKCDIKQALSEINEQVETLQKAYPQAAQAVEAFPGLGSFNTSQLADMAKWLTDFAAACSEQRRKNPKPRVKLTEHVSSQAAVPGGAIEGASGPTTSDK
jgi:hypothetical protein